MIGQMTCTLEPVLEGGREHCYDRPDGMGRAVRLRKPPVPSLIFPVKRDIVPKLPPLRAYLLLYPQQFQEISLFCFGRIVKSKFREMKISILNFLKIMAYRDTPAIKIVKHG